MGFAGNMGFAGRCAGPFPSVSPSPERSGSRKERRSASCQGHGGWAPRAGGGAPVLDSPEQHGKAPRGGQEGKPDGTSGRGPRSVDGAEDPRPPSGSSRNAPGPEISGSAR